MPFFLTTWLIDGLGWCFGGRSFMKEILMKVVPPLNGKGLGPKPPILPLVETGVFSTGMF